MEGLKELLIEELQDLYSAEKQISKALPAFIDAAQSEELKAALTDHLEVTNVHVERLETVFAAAGERAKAKHCKGMEGLIAEGNECLGSREPSHLRDLAIIGACQRVELYEVAAYGTACAMAENCGLPECLELLRETLVEEEEADQTLTEVADGIFEFSKRTLHEGEVIAPRL